MTDSRSTENAAPGGTSAADCSIPGMTLRNWFAGQALAGLAGRLISPTEWDGDCIASAAYELADSMIEEMESNNRVSGPQPAQETP